MRSFTPVGLAVLGSLLLTSVVWESGTQGHPCPADGRVDGAAIL